MPASTLGRGNIIYDFLVQVSLTPVAVAGSTAAEQTFTIPGMQATDYADMNCTVAQTAGIGTGNVRCGVNSLIVEFTNSTAGSLTPTSGSYIINVTRPENLPIQSNAF